MGVSFKVARTGTRYRPRLSQLPDTLASEKDGPPDDRPLGPLPEKPPPVDKEFVAAYSARKPELFENEISFSLNLFPEGFSIGEPDQGVNSHLLQNVPKVLHPYNKASKSLFSSIENGWLPGDVFDDLPCKYLNGTILCEVRDFRNCNPPLGHNISPVSSYPVVERVQLQMCTENVVNDLHLISEDTWTYRDLLEVESRIVKALQPVLCLDPSSFVDRPLKRPVLRKLDFGIHFQHMKKQNGVSSVKPIANLTFQGKEVYGDVKNFKPKEKLAVPDALPGVEDKTRGQAAQINTLPSKMLPNCQAPTSCTQSFCKSAGTTSNFELGTKKKFGDQRIPQLASLGKRVRSKAQISHKSKKPKKELVNSVQQRFPGSQVEILASKDFQCKTNLQSHFDAYKGQYVGLTHKPNVKLHMGKQNLCPSPMQWSQCMKEDLSGYEVSSDTRPSQNLQGSDMPTVSPPSLFKCGEHSIYLSEFTNAAFSLPAEVKPDKEKSTRAASVNSCNHMSDCKKQRANSVARASSKSTCGSPVSVGNMSTQSCVNSPMVGTTEVPTYPEPEGSQTVLGNFMKIKMLTERYNLNIRDKKVDIHHDGKWSNCSHELLVVEFSQLENTEGFGDESMPMSKCLIDGTTNNCKTRRMTFVPRVLRGNRVPLFVRGRPSQLLMFETPKDRMVEAQIIVADEHCDPCLLPTFPNTHHADLFAAQFTSLMLKEGYRVLQDQLQPLPSGSQLSFNTSSFSHSAKPAISGQPLDPRNLVIGAAPKPTHQLPSSADRRREACMHSHANLQALPLLSADLVWPQMDPIYHLEKSLPVVRNAVGRSTFPGDMPIYPLQQYRLQQWQRQQLQQQFAKRRLMAGAMGPAASMGGAGNRFLELGNVAGTGRAYCGPAGMVDLSQSNKRLAHISNFGLLNQQALPGTKSQTASMTNIQLGHGHGRGMVSGGATWGPIESVVGMAGIGSMISGATTTQFPAIGGISPSSTLMFSGGNYGMNQQQQLQVGSPLLEQDVVQQQVGSPMQQVGSPMQPIGSPMEQHSGNRLDGQAVGSPIQQHQYSEVGSPVPHVCPQQLSQQMGSPQLNSLTRGSIESIDNLPMDLQGAPTGATTSSGGHGGE